MKMRFATMTLLMLGVFASSVLAQHAENNWENLNALRVGQKVVVVDMALKTHKGTFLSYNDEVISVRTDGGDQGIARANVLRVSNREHSKRARNTLLGAGIGAGVALAVGAAVDASFSEQGEHIAKAILTPIGAGAGAAIGSAFASYQTIYRAPIRTSP